MKTISCTETALHLAVSDFRFDFQENIQPEAIILCHIICPFIIVVTDFRLRRCKYSFTQLEFWLYLTRPYWSRSGVSNHDLL
jgi:hypothetical protein